MARPLAVKGITLSSRSRRCRRARRWGHGNERRRRKRRRRLSLAQVLSSCVRRGRTRVHEGGSGQPSRSRRPPQCQRADDKREKSTYSGRGPFPSVLFSLQGCLLPNSTASTGAAWGSALIQNQTPEHGARCSEPLTGDQGVGRVSQACPTPGPALVDAAALSVRRAEAWAAMVVMAHLRPAQRTLASPNARSSYICFRAQSFRRLSLLCVERDSPCSDSTSG